MPDIRRHQDIADDPRRPVVQILAGEAHPPFAVVFHEGTQHAPFHLAADAIVQVGMELALQQLGGKGEDHRRLSGEEIDDRPLIVREGVFLAQSGMGADGPGGFFAQECHPVLHIGKEFVRPGQAHMEHRGTELPAPFKIGRFAIAPAAGADEGCIHSGGQQRPGLLAPGVGKVHEASLVRRIDGLPGGAVSHRRELGNISHICDGMGGKVGFQHIDSFRS